MVLQFLSTTPLWWPMQGSVRNSTDLTVVSDLLTHPRQPLSSCRWNIPLVRSLYSEPIANCILSLPISITNSKDSLTWTKNASGSYSAKEGFSLLFDDKFQNQPAFDPFWKFLWSISLPQKQLLFLWKLFNKAIPSSDVLLAHHLQVNSLCHFGCSDADSIHHIFFSCHLVKAAWFGCFSMCPPSHLSLNDLLSWLKQLLFSSKDDEILLKNIISFLNDIWRKRNQTAHGGRIPHP